MPRKKAEKDVLKPLSQDKRLWNPKPLREVYKSGQPVEKKLVLVIKVTNKAEFEKTMTNSIKNELAQMGFDMADLECFQYQSGQKMAFEVIIQCKDMSDKIDDIAGQGKMSFDDPLASDTDNSVPVDDEEANEE